MRCFYLVIKISPPLADARYVWRSHFNLCALEAHTLSSPGSRGGDRGVKFVSVTWDFRRWDGIHRFFASPLHWRSETSATFPCPRVYVVVRCFIYFNHSWTVSTSVAIDVPLQLIILTLWSVISSRVGDCNCGSKRSWCVSTCLP